MLKVDSKSPEKCINTKSFFSFTVFFEWKLNGKLVGRSFECVLNGKKVFHQNRTILLQLRYSKAKHNGLNFFYVLWKRINFEIFLFENKKIKWNLWKFLWKNKKIYKISMKYENFLWKVSVSEYNKHMYRIINWYDEAN